MLTFGVAACRPLGLVVAMNDGGNILAGCYHVVDADTKFKGELRFRPDQDARERDGQVDAALTVTEKDERAATLLRGSHWAGRGKRTDEDLDLILDLTDPATSGASRLSIRATIHYGRISGVILDPYNEAAVESFTMKRC